MANIQKWTDGNILARGSEGGRQIASDADCCCWDCPDCACANPGGDSSIAGYTATITGFSGDCAVFNQTYQMLYLGGPPGDPCELFGDSGIPATPILYATCTTLAPWLGCFQKWHIEVLRLKTAWTPPHVYDCIAAVCGGADLECATTGYPLGTVTLTAYTDTTGPPPPTSDCDTCGCPDNCQVGSVTFSQAP